MSNIRIFITFSLAVLLFRHIFAIDLADRGSIREGQCQATCLSKFGYSFQHVLRSGNSVKRYRCINDCEDCWNACTLNSHDCHSKCHRMKNSSTCAFGCDRLAQISKSDVDQESPMDVTNSTTSLYGSITFMCMNALQNEASSILASFLVQLDVEPSTPFVLLYESRYKLYNMRIRNYTASNWLTLGVRPSKNFALRSMFPSTQYQVRAVAIDKTGLIYPDAMVSPWIETLPEDAPLKPPISIRVVAQQPSVRGQMTAIIEWTPDPLYPSCFYRLVWRDSNHTESRAFPVDEGYQYVIHKLSYSIEYTVMIRSIRDTKSASPESSPIVTTFTTWSCLEANRFSFQDCAPGSVASLDANVHENATAIVSWNPPAYVSVVNNFSHYVVRWRSLTHVGRCHKRIERTMNLEPDQRRFVVPSLGANCHYVFGIAPVSNGGVGRESVVEFNYTVLDDPYSILDRANVTVTYVEPNFEQLYALLLIPFSVLLTLGVVLIYFKIRPRQPIAKKNLIDPHHIALRSILQRNETYRCAGVSQISRPKLDCDLGPFTELIDIVGHGEFGCVYKAHCKRGGFPYVVAVKTLRAGDSNALAERTLDKEIETMHRLGEPHQNVVRFYGVGFFNIRGYVTKGLVMEYCSEGNLKDYLKKLRDELTRQIKKSNLSPTDSGYGALEFTLPDPQPAIVDLSPPIGPDIESRLLISYVWQVACGMDHLSRQQLVHRDLAARNILVDGDGRTVKISDFGLCRIIDAVGEYHLTTKHPKLPVRWMAPEAMRGVYTSQSDVWSFGILMWEIFTIGSVPYSGYDNVQVPDLVATGYRLPKPSNCDQESYDVMIQCWQTAPSDRPTFAQLRSRLEKLMECSEQRLYLELV